MNGLIAILCVRLPRAEAVPRRQAASLLSSTVQAFVQTCQAHAHCSPAGASTRCSSLPLHSCSLRMWLRVKDVSPVETKWPIAAPRRAAPHEVHSIGCVSFAAAGFHASVPGVRLLHAAAHLLLLHPFAAPDSLT